jgi:hypothetical protein
VRQGQQNRRGRGRNNNRKNHNPLARSFESNGPDVKIRGTPAHIAEKYLSLSRDAQSSGDPVLAENYLQHAEHYMRIIMAYREQLAQPGDMANGNGQRMRGPEFGDVGDEFGDDEGEEGLDDGFQPPLPPQQPPQQHQPPQRQHGYEAGNRQEGGGRHDRPFRRDHGRFQNRDRHRDRDRDRHGENRQATPDRPQEPAEASGEPQQRQRERFPQQPHEQPEFLRRPVRRARSEGEAAASPGKEDPPRE